VGKRWNEKRNDLEGVKEDQKKKKKEGLMLKKKFFGLLDVQLVEGEKR